MAEIVPAVLVRRFEELKESLARVAGYIPMVQIDVCDGSFTPNSSWPYSTRNEVGLSKLVSEEEGLPYWDKLDFEIDMMVSHPEDEIEKWIAAGAKRLIVHIESTTPDAMRKIVDDLKDRGVELGIALNIDTPIEAIDSYASDIAIVQCMGIVRIGFQGESFDPRVVEKVTALKRRFSDLLVSVDGGVNLDTAPSLVDAGADQLVVGSALFGSLDLLGTLDDLEAI